MFRQVQVLADNVALPDGRVYQTGDQVILPRAQYELIDKSLIDTGESESESSGDVFYVLDQGDVAILTVT